MPRYTWSFFRRKGLYVSIRDLFGLKLMCLLLHVSYLKPRERESFYLFAWHYEAEETMWQLKHIWKTGVCFSLVNQAYLCAPKYTSMWLKRKRKRESGQTVQVHIEYINFIVMCSKELNDLYRLSQSIVFLGL